MEAVGINKRQALASTSVEVPSGEDACCTTKWVHVLIHYSYVVPHSRSPTWLLKFCVSRCWTSPHDPVCEPSGVCDYLLYLFLAHVPEGTQPPVHRPTLLCCKSGHQHTSRLHTSMYIVHISKLLLLLDLNVICVCRNIIDIERIHVQYVLFYWWYLFSENYIVVPISLFHNQAR